MWNKLSNYYANSNKLTFIHPESIFFYKGFLWQNFIPLCHIHQLKNIQIILCNFAWDDNLFLIILHIIIRLLLNEIYIPWDFSFNSFMMECYLMVSVDFSLLDNLILYFITAIWHPLWILTLFGYYPITGNQLTKCTSQPKAKPVIITRGIKINKFD